MKNPIVILSILLLILGGLLWYQTDSKNEYKDKYDNLKETQSIKIKDTLNAISIKITDSMHVQFHKYNDSLVKQLINEKNEKTIDSIRSLNDNEFDDYLRSVESRFGLRP